MSRVPIIYLHYHRILLKHCHPKTREISPSDAREGLAEAHVLKSLRWQVIKEMEEWGLLKILHKRTILVNYPIQGLQPMERATMSILDFD